VSRRVESAFRTPGDSSLRSIDLASTGTPQEFIRCGNVRLCALEGVGSRPLLADQLEGAAPNDAAMDYAGMIRKLKSGEYRLYSRKIDPKTGRRRNLGTFSSREKAQKHEREVQFFKRRG
jgi:hypothetical protein